jgi:MYXO-CTERM domain-containing protein
MWWMIATAWAQDPADILGNDGDAIDWSLPPAVIHGPPPGAGPDPIVNGEATEEFENVVALGYADPTGAPGDMFVFCSGNLIEKRWILTAGHCVAETSGDRFVLFGNDITHDGYTLAVPWKSSDVHPDFDGSSYDIHDDIAIVEMGQPKLGIQIMVLNDTPPDDSWIGEDLTFVGFGITSDRETDSGTKRTTKFPLTGWDDSNLLEGDPAHETNVCNGDSGGATLRTTDAGYELAGINDYVTPGCVGGTAGSTRVDTKIDWIRGYVPYILTEPRDPKLDSAGNWDLGVDDPDWGLSQFPEPTGTYEPGCSTTATGPAWTAVLAGLALVLARRRR